MEGDAHQLFRRAARRQKKRRRLVGRDSELAAQSIGRPLRLDRQTHDQIEIARAAGGVENLGQLVMAVEREGPHPVIEIGAGDGRPALDRVHEGHAGARRVAGHELDFRNRRDIERPHAIFRQGLDDPRGRIGLYRVKDVAVKISLEPARRYGQNVGAHKCDRTLRRPLTDQVQGRMIRVQFT